ncbi:MAG: protein kinase domain-containing protein [Acidobacteriota bacterium]
MTQKIGRYDIEGTIGRGAMGVVYRARDPIIGRALAIKVVSLSGGLADDAKEEYRQRFFREAQAAGNLHHPNIVTVFDAGEERGVPYLVMELVEGESLAQRLKRAGKLSVEEASSIARQVAAGLAYAHEKGVVHRDIKPANILLDAKGRAAITDFGVARLSASDLTRTGEVLGTPNFMSPEQVLGQALDGRSDLFSLGVVYYLMLTGDRPFKGEEVSAICYNVVHSEPVPPVSSLPLPAEVAGILDRLLRKNPAERFSDGETAAAALREVTERTQVVASPVANASQRPPAGGSAGGATRPATAAVGQAATMAAPPRGLGRGAKAAFTALAVLAAAGVIVASWLIATRWRARSVPPVGVQATAPKESAPPPAAKALPGPAKAFPGPTPAPSAASPATGMAVPAAAKTRTAPPPAKPIPVGIVAEGPLASGRIRVEAGGKILLDRPFLGGFGRGRKGLLLADRLLLAPGEQKVTIAVVSERPSPFAADTNETVLVPSAGEVTLTVRARRYPDRLAVALVPTADLPERLAGLLSEVEAAPGASGSEASGAAAETAHFTLVVEGPLDRGQIVFFVDGRLEKVVPIPDLPRRQDGTGFRLEVSRDLLARTYALGFEVKAPRPFPFFAAARRTVTFQPGQRLKLVVHCRRDPARLEVEEERR